MSTYTNHLITLADLMAEHANVTHWAISLRMCGKGDIFDRLRRGGDVRTATYEELMGRFSENWPTDLEWPRDIPRPAKPKSKEAA